MQLSTNTSEQDIDFIRHGKTYLNTYGQLFQGICDAELTPLGQKQIEKAALALIQKGKYISYVAVSWKARTQETWSILEPLLREAHIIDDNTVVCCRDDCEERHYGAIELGPPYATNERSTHDYNYYECIPEKEEKDFERKYFGRQKAYYSLGTLNKTQWNTRLNFFASVINTLDLPESKKAEIIIRTRALNPYEIFKDISGEDLVSIQLRIHRALIDIIQNKTYLCKKEGSTLIVCHGGVLKTARNLIHKATIKEIEEDSKKTPSNGQIITVTLPSDEDEAINEIEEYSLMLQKS